MDTITKLNDLKWQKIYLPVQEENKPTLEQVKARADAVTAVAGTAIVIYDPATGKQKVFIEQDPAAPSIAPDKLGLKPIYLVSKPKAEKKALASQMNSADAAYFKSIQDERMKLMANMTIRGTYRRYAAGNVLDDESGPADTPEIMVDQMNARQNMDPESRTNTSR